MSRRPSDPRAAAEAAFRPKRPAAPAPAQSAALPGAREQVTLRIDQDVLELFQDDGPGWQDRINATLREAVRAQLAAKSGDALIRVENLSGENDDGAG